MIAADAPPIGSRSTIPDRIEKLILLDIVPVYDMWHRLTRDLAMQIFHWTFLAQPAPWPEEIIGRDPVGWLDHKLARWGGSGDLSVFAPEALAHYRAFFSEPARIHATCEDYRAGAGYDLAADEADRAAGTPHRLPGRGVLGGEGHSQQDERSARHLEDMVRQRRGPGDRIRTFPAGGKSG